jgi:hypothetical protein
VRCWFRHRSVTLKKFATAAKRLPNGKVGCSPIDFEVTYSFSMQLVRRSPVLRRSLEAAGTAS